ncbi:hypothetical protein R3P38DRAFT_3388835 [Favolaschia claudopus]|uniref:F-box domain-containing protein n=1 Tax=Favolaschia claudopus TaxID=2862362 RepID=A0AAW0D107_9AGAR
MLPALPTEILEAVVDASRDDLATVAACGAAARQFLLRSRMHLFAEISLDSPRANITRTKSSLHVFYPSIPTRCDFLAELLQVNPSLARCVTRLTLSEGGHPSVTTYWISQSTTLVPFARRLTNLRKFTLREGNGSEWSPALIQTLHLCLHAPSIESVELVGLRVTELPSLFTIFSTQRPGKRLQTLHLSNLGVPSAPFGLSTITEHAPEKNRVEVISLGISSPQVQELVAQQRLLDILSQSPPLVNLSALRRLRLDVDDRSFALQWIQFAGQSLVQLDWELKYFWSQLVDTSDEDMLLEHLSTLRFVVIKPEALLAAPAILRSLKALTLTDIVFYSREAWTSPNEDVGALWVTLDSLLSKQFFPSLSAVRFESDIPDSDATVWHSLLRSKLPTLNKSKMLALIIRRLCIGINSPSQRIC